MLIADHDAGSRRLLEQTLAEWEFKVQVAGDGVQALAALEAADAPPMAILDWEMPGMAGPEICRRVRVLQRPVPTYILLLTSRSGTESIVEGLQSGANDYLAKPFHPDELRARLHVGRSMIELQQNLAGQVRQLEEALAQIRLLQGLLPICSYCKKIRDDQNYWHQVESYLTVLSGAKFSHSICPDCYTKNVEPMLKRLQDKK